MSRLRTLLALDQPQETRFFLFLAAFGVVITVIYWFASYEVAGTGLLVGYTLATGLIGLRLAVDPAAGLVRRRVRERRTLISDERPDAPGTTGAGHESTGGGTGGIATPFLDEAGRLPSPSLAPIAVGLGIALAATATIFGLAPLIVGALPFAWGARAWLLGAGAEYDAIDVVEPVELPETVEPAEERRPG